jgi:phospholipase/carboxylesterase
MHGLGDNADNYLGLFNNPEVTPLSPDIKVILPTAPERALTKNNGEVMTSWFDIK